MKKLIATVLLITTLSVTAFADGEIPTGDRSGNLTTSSSVGEIPTGDFCGEIPTGDRSDSPCLSNDSSGKDQKSIYKDLMKYLNMLFGVM